MELASLRLTVKYCDERIVCLPAGEYLEYQMSKLLHIFEACCLWRIMWRSLGSPLSLCVSGFIYSFIHQNVHWQ